MGRWVLGAVLLGGCATPGAATLPSLMATRAAPEMVKAAPDWDGDGYADRFDVCPVVAGIAPDGCPERDGDADGFLDSQDRCSEVWGVEPDGCPIPDTDGDGILDPDDRCVAVVETKNGFFDEDGCGDEIPAEVEKIVGPIKGLKFDLDKDTIRPSSRAALERVVAALAKYPTLRVELSGHTDSTGPNIGRTDLSGRRARSVKNYLVEHGIAADRVETRGAGPDEPVDTNKTAAGRAKNRRVEITILLQ